MDAVNALGVRRSPSEHDCPMLTAAPSPQARTEVRGWGRGGKQRRADPVLAPEAGGRRQQEPCCPGGRYRTWGWKMLAGWFSAGWLSSSTGAGAPAGPEGSACLPPPTHPQQLCLCLGWFRQPSPSCGPLGTRDPSACIHQASWDFPVP